MYPALTKRILEGQMNTDAETQGVVFFFKKNHYFKFTEIFSKDTISSSQAVMDGILHITD